MYAVSAKKRVVLVGSSGTGKSATGNLLVKGETSETPFKVSDDVNSCTDKISMAFSEKLPGLLIVDTPGLGDHPEKRDGESDADHEKRSKDNSWAHFKAISHDLHQNGGLVLYVHKHGRLDGRANRHMQALRYAMKEHLMLLVITHLPDKIKPHAQRLERADREALREFYVKNYKDVSKDAFVAVVFLPSEPTTPCVDNFTSTVLDFLDWAFVPAKVVTSYKTKVEKHAEVEAFTKEAEAAIPVYEAKIKHLEHTIREQEKHIKQGSDGVLAGAIVGGVLEPFCWIFGGLGAGVGVGGLIAGGAGATVAVAQRKLAVANDARCLVQRQLETARISVQDHENTRQVLQKIQELVAK